MSNIIVSNSFDLLKQELAAFGQVYVVYDRNVGSYVSELEAYPSLAITSDEEHKTLDTVLEISRWLLSLGADRNALVLAVGGGVTTDIVGFSASVYKRGLRYANVPTTLLSQVDAAIGGKTGCNLDSYKNMLGVIVQPQFTYICTETLRTLPQRQLRSGLAEMLKTFIIENREDGYERTVKLFSADSLDFEALTPLVKAAAMVKERVITEDPFEKGLRRVLNLGHTWGHAVEWWQHTHDVADPYTHGEAVAVGMVCAARMSEKLGLAAAGTADRLSADFVACGLPVELPCPETELEAAMAKDKKSEDGKINYILIENIGKVTIRKI